MARVIQDVAREGVAVPGLSLRLVELEPGAQTELSGDGETMAYVVEGRGETALGPLEPESVVWLDPGDALAVEAGIGGLRLLVGHARYAPGV
jgi:uncharacterized RmlC-like cupin family protein